VKFALQLLEQQLKEQKNGKSLFQNLALKYVIRNVKENKERPKFNVAHHLLDCVVDVHLLWKNIQIIKKTYTLPGRSKDAGIKVNAQKTKYSNTSPNTLFQSTVLTVYSWL